MDVLEFLRRGGDDETCDLYECRDCGEKVSPTTEECPSCGSTEIACFRF